MVKARDGEARVSYSVRLKPDLIPQLKHIAVDENKPISELIEEGISIVIQKRVKAKK